MTDPSIAQVDKVDYCKSRCGEMVGGGLPVYVWQGDRLNGWNPGDGPVEPNQVFLACQAHYDRMVRDMQNNPYWLVLEQCSDCEGQLVHILPDAAVVMAPHRSDGPQRFETSAREPVKEGPLSQVDRILVEQLAQPSR
ncbi:MAG: hypothetical protein ABH879_02565 [archaeon]